MSNFIDTTIEIEDDEIQVEVEFHYEPGDPGVWTYSNGDPGYAPTGPVVEIIAVRDESKVDYINQLSSKQLETIEEFILNYKPDYD